jgi:hypothetical protein
MDETTRASITQLVMALKAFTKSVEKSVHYGMFEGTGDTVLRQARSLHARAKQLLPDDYFISDVIMLDATAESSDEEKNMQVRLMTDQLLDYLQSIVKSDQSVTIRAEVDDLKDVGRELQSQILQMTRKALKRAIVHMDIDTEDFDIPEPPSPPEPPASPVPPIPPVPPVPPHR